MHREIYRQLCLQSIFTLICVVLAYLFGNLQVGYSALLGGLVVIISSYIFALFAFRYHGARAVGKMLASFFFGELSKLVVMALLIVFILKFIPVQALVFLITFLGVQFFTTTLGFWQANASRASS